MSRRLRIWLIALAIIAVLLALTLRWIAHPDRVAAMILTRTGTALGLEITASGASEYRLLGTPMLAVRDVIAKQPGATTPLLRAKRIYLTLPWSTIRAGGADLTVKRVELEAPQLDIAALQRWLATRPPSETKIPTLTEGLQIVDGQVIGDGWSMRGVRSGSAVAVSGSPRASATARALWTRRDAPAFRRACRTDQACDRRRPGPFRPSFGRIVAIGSCR